MRLVIAYDNTAAREDLVADWGFSCVVEIEGCPRMLFDAGGSGAILLGNLARLGYSAGDFEEVVVSHAHYDHTGGLSALLDENPGLVVYGPPSFRGLKRAREYRPVPGPLEIHPGVFLSGEIAGVEQFLAARTARGLAVLTGCAHPPMAEILRVAAGFGRVTAVVGGLHDFADLDLFSGLERICPAHCTRRAEEIRARFPGAAVPAGAGAILEL